MFCLVPTALAVLFVSLADTYDAPFLYGVAGFFACIAGAMIVLELDAYFRRKRMAQLTSSEVNRRLQQRRAQRESVLSPETHQRIREAVAARADYRA